MKTILSLFLIIFLAEQSYGQLPKKTDTVRVNNIDLYYEVYGEGKPLLLLHGWTQSSQFWSAYIPDYAKTFEVYAVDLRGHGRSTPLAKDFSIKKTADDLIALLDHLSLKKVKAIGLSFGGITLLQLASLHPNRIEAMVLIGAAHNYSGKDNNTLDDKFNFDDLPAQFIEQLKKTHVHGDPQIRALFNPELNYEIRLSDESLRAIQAKTLVVSGDRDEILGVQAAFALHAHLPHSSLWVLPDQGHIPINDTNRSDFIGTTLAFLDPDKEENSTDKN